MTATELKAELKRLGVTPPEPLRASLYLQELQAAYDFFRADDFVSSGYAKVKTAVQDPALLNALARALDPFVSEAVNADLTARGNPARLSSFAAYYDGFILGDEYVTRRDDFYQRYPVTDNIVKKIGVNFRKNIKTACQRIITDWDIIQSTFVGSPKQLVKLTRIKSSGSDFHKGGQQVLLLTFETVALVEDTLDTGTILVDHVSALNFNLNLVYKPSDLEADCLLAGNSAAVTAVHRNFQQQSLFELLNTLITRAKQQNANLELELLPTYKILPMVYGSGLQAAGTNLPIRTAYGYLEFLQHDHFDGLFSTLGLYWGGSSDFKIFPSQNKDAICQKFYRIIGQLTAIACTFSIVDLHLENVIVKNYIPYPIDMEVSLTTLITTVTDTALFGGGAGAVTAATGAGITTIREDGGQGALMLEQEQHTEPQQNRLWMVDGAAPIHPADYAAALCRALRDMLGVIQRANTQGKFETWLMRIEGVIVRYLPYTTGDFAAILRAATGARSCGDNTLLPKFISISRGEVYRNWDRDSDKATKDPRFLALQDANVTADYQNADIPIFYHRFAEGATFGMNIIDSRGDIVTVPAQINYRTAPTGNPIAVDVALGESRDGKFFAQSPLQLRVEAQLTYLTDNLNQRVQTLVGQILQQLGLAHAGGDVQAVLQ